MRSIKNILQAQKVNMGGILLDQPLPVGNINFIDPFLLIHHWASKMPGGEKQQETGVGPHPHRGFSPVTFIFKGTLHHRDSLGTSSIISAGGTQWMFAGRGITHSERPDQQLADEGGEFEIIQFWVNVPAANKLGDPYYQGIKAEDTPVFTSPDELSRVAIVAGEYQGLKGPARTFTRMKAFRIEMKAGGVLNFDIPEGDNCLLYQLDGLTKVNDTEKSGTKTMVRFEKTGDPGIKLEAERDSRLILLSGEPIDEPMVSYGPFVMNNQTEIMQAMRDAQMGKMGILIEEF